MQTYSKECPRAAAATARPVHTATRMSWQALLMHAQAAAFIVLCLTYLMLMQVCLIAVAVLWGTYSPAYRLIYAQPGPPQPPVLTALRASLQALLLIPPAALQASRASKKSR